jgi:hypothetical protein
VKVITDFIPQSLQDEIQREVNNNNSFPWFFVDEIASSDKSEYSKKDMPTWDESQCFIPLGFAHTVCGGGTIFSPYYELFRHVIRFLELKEGFTLDYFIRVRLRRTVQQVGHNDSMYNLPHVDYPAEQKFMTFVYYVEDSDGDTIMFDHLHENGSNASLNTKLNIVKRIPPVKGTGILFDGNRYHAGNCPINYKTRTIINYDFTVK